jgi:hypothetical protein
VSRGERWTPAEEEIIRKNIALPAKALNALLPNRTPKAVSSRKELLPKLPSRATLVPWTIDEDELLLSHCPDWKLLQRLLPGRTFEAIRYRSKKLDRTAICTAWTGREIRWLRNEGRTMSAEECAIELGRSIVAIKRARTRWGASLHRRGTSKDLLIQDIRDRAKHLGLSNTDVQRMTGRRSPFLLPKHSSNRSVSAAFDAVRVLGGTLVAVWDE